MPFYENIGPSFYYKEAGRKIGITLNESNNCCTAVENGVFYSLRHTANGETLTLTATIKNTSSADFVHVNTSKDITVEINGIKIPVKKG